MIVAPRVLMRSIAWSSGGAMVMRFGQLLVGVIAARILAPNDFGLFAVTLVVYNVIVNVSELGVSSALIRERGDLEAKAPTAVTISLLSATCLAVTMAFGSPLLAQLLGAEGSMKPILVMSLVVLLAGPTAVPAALLTKEFRQDLRFRADLLNFLAGSALLVGGSLAGWGVMALAWSRVAGQAASAVALLLMSPTRYKPGFRLSAAKSLMSFGAPLVGANLLVFAIYSLDSVVLAHVVGTIPLGAYTLANNVSGWPLAMLLPVLLNVGLPLLARATHDKALLGDWLRIIISLLTGLFLFASCMLAALATPLVLALYGEKWRDGGVVLTGLAVFAFLRAIDAVLADVLVAVHATKRLLLSNVVWLVTLLPLLIFGAQAGGAVGVSLVHIAVAAFVVLPLTFYFVSTASGVDLRRVFSPSWLPVASSIGVALLVHGLTLGIHDPWMALLLGAVTGVAVYGALTWRWMRKTITEARRVLTTDETAMQNSVTIQDEAIALEAHNLREGQNELNWLGDTPWTYPAAGADDPSPDAVKSKPEVRHAPTSDYDH